MLVCAVWIVCVQASAQDTHLGINAPWPQGTSPQEVGKLVAERFAASPFGGYSNLMWQDVLHYAEGCTWYGALTFAQLSGDTTLQQKLIRRFDPLLNEQAHLVPAPDHVDKTMFAAVPLELFLHTKDRRYLDFGKNMADAQWEEPTGQYAADEAQTYFQRGLSWQTRMWIDDMYMITAAQAQAYRATGDRTYIDRAAKEMVVYLDSLQRPNGLFYHAPDVPFFWGRGNGWMAAGMAELLRSLPEDNPHHSRIMQGYTTMMSALLKYQAEDGMWRQLIDHPESWQETSSTGMFTFAMITGVKAGWLDERTYGPAARKAWLALVSYIDQHGDIREVCEGTGKKNDFQYYLNRKRNIGDMHGQAPILWCASALLR